MAEKITLASFQQAQETQEEIAFRYNGKNRAGKVYKVRPEYNGVTMNLNNGEIKTFLLAKMQPFNESARV